EISEEVHPLKVGKGAPAVDVSSYDRAVSIGMAVLVDRKGEAGLITCPTPKAAGSFHDVPSIILTLSTPLRGRGDIDLLQAALPYVRDIQIAVGPIEAEPPGVAQTVTPHLGSNG